MKTFILATIALCACFGARVHEFHAENNIIHEICNHVTQNVPASSILEKFQAPISESELAEVCQRASQNLLEFEDHSPVDMQSHARIVNSNPTSTWTAGVNEKFVNMSRSEIKKMMGTVVDPAWRIRSEPREVEDNFVGDLPKEFNAAEKWPQCASVINHIRDQSNCGSCWAHGTTEAFNDRLCIKNGNTDLLSVSDTTGCCGFLSCFSMGCSGGQVGTPWSWFDSTGVVTGGDFGDKKLCYPYTMPKCAHHVDGTGMPDCSAVEQVSPKCSKSCDSGDGREYAGDKKKASTSYGLSDPESIKKDLVQYGSVTAAFTVYEDFTSYKSGVYKHTTGSMLGGHAVKIVGYGQENGQDYWLVNNSWNDKWGDNGQFKIAFGDCGIDGGAHAGLV